MTLNLSAIRADTPGVESVLHFNNAGAALMPAPVVETVLEHVRLEARIGGYEAAEQCSERLEAVYQSVARLLNCAPDEVALQENATRAWTAAFYAFSFQPGDRILTSVTEYASNYLAFLQIARKTGASIEAVPGDGWGQMDLSALKRRLDSRVKLIALSHIPTNGGLVQPAAEIGAIAREANIPFLLDACQSAGQLALDFQKLGCDILTATGRKYLRGPRGTGFLVVRRELLESLEPPMIDLHSATWSGADSYTMRPDARRFEVWEFNHADRLGLGTAVDYALALGMDAIEPRIEALAAGLREGLGLIRGVQVRDLGKHRCGIVTFELAGHSAQSVKAQLGQQGINVSVAGPAGALLDAEARKLPPLVRASVHYYNSEQEVERFRQAIATLAGEISG